MGIDLRRALLAVFLLALPLRGEDAFRPRVTLAWESRDSGVTSTTQLRQQVDLFLSRALSERISVRASFGAQRYDLDTAKPGFVTTNAKSLELRPSGSIDAAFGPLSTRTDYALRRARHDLEELRSERDDEQFRTTLALAQTRFFPAASLNARRSRITDRSGSTNLANDAVEGALSYAWRELALHVGRSLRVDRDSRGSYERRATDSLAGLSYSAIWLEGKLTFSGAANGSMTRLDDRAGRISEVPAFVQPARAFWGIDDTPLESTDAPPTSTPALIDGRLGVSTGINLGPDGAGFQNLVLDIGRVAPVDQIRVTVRDERGDPVLTPDGIRWDVYTSLDGERWVLHAADALTEFDRVRSEYGVDFEQVDVRWIKVVTFGVAAQPAFVTEIQLVDLIAIGDETRESEFRNLSSNAVFTFNPVRTVSFSYSGSSYQSSQESGRTLASDVTDFTHMLSARHDPSSRFGYELRYELHDSQVDRTSQDSEAYAASFRYAPRPELTTTLTCEVRSETLLDVLIEGRGCSTQVTARVFPTLEVSAGASLRDQELAEGSLRSRTLYSSAAARVTKTLRMTISGSMSRSEIDDWTGPTPPPSSDERITADADWSPGRALGLGGTFGWAGGERGSGLVQRYRIRWLPFADGAVSITTSYTRDIDPYTNSRSERWLVSPRWQINQRAALNLTYSSVSTTGEQAFDSESILAALILGR